MRAIKNKKDLKNKFSLVIDFKFISNIYPK